MKRWVDSSSTRRRSWTDKSVETEYKTAMDKIEVSSHVARDLLQSAALFKEEKDVVWEYVVNSLQYVNSGVAPRVQVWIRPTKKEIEIGDNGRGM